MFGEWNSNKETSDVNAIKKYFLEFFQKYFSQNKYFLVKKFWVNFFHLFFPSVKK